MNYSEYITSTHSGPIDNYGYSSIQYHSQNLLINHHSVQQSYRPRSLTRISESSSGIEIIDEETTENHSSDSEPSIIRYHNPSSRRVIINSTNQTVTISNKQQPRTHRNRRDQRKKSYDKYSSSKYKSQHSSSSSSRHRNHKEDRLKYLLDKYSSEDVQKEWRPLTFFESEELYQYAVDKYHKKPRYN